MIAKRPFCRVALARDWKRAWGWTLIVLLAPFPAEEQIEGELVRALVNAECWVQPSWPFIGFRLDSWGRDTGWG